ncbi:MAG: DUF72 domain-containing protein [Bacteroidetes bacterium]|jgi:uncharacterized protein YecE (DUF72 family)|nr:DUF72 domain-containing protein [Bacteroidota bacterium]
MSTPSSLPERRAAADAYQFRKIHPAVRFGTASDRYGGWIGQIYPEEAYADQVSTRSRKMRGQSFEERRVPVASVQDYFAHFSTLEIDFTFYRPLLDAAGEPTPAYFTLDQYAEHAPANARFLLKAPQPYTARQVRRTVEGQAQFVENPTYLDATAYTEQFHEPALHILGDRLVGVIFQQEYQRVADSPSSDENINTLSTFFDRIPADERQVHLELRSEHLLTEAYFNFLAEAGLGHVFSHWTWLPMIRTQWFRCGERFTAANAEAVTRLLTPRDMKYAEAYARAHPFDEPVPALFDTPEARAMVLDATALALQAHAQQATLHLIANNRAWGNAPELARTIAHRILDEEEKRTTASEEPASEDV